VPLEMELTAPGVALTVATMAAFEEVQLACVVTSLCVPSLYTAVAVSCAPVPNAAWAFFAVTSIDCRVTVLLLEPLPPPPQPARMPIRAARRTHCKLERVREQVIVLILLFGGVKRRIAAVQRVQMVCRPV
jgi:hypothetical protein